MCCYTTREYINNWIGTLFSSEICGIFQPEILIWRCHRLTTADFRYHHHHHHIRFWYLRCCGCPGLRGRQHHQQTNTKFFTGRMSFLSPNQQRQSTVRGTPCKFTYWLLTEVCVTHLPDFTQDHQRYPYTQQYVQFVTCCSLDACLLCWRLYVLSSSKDFFVPTLTWKFFRQLLSSVSFKQIKKF